MSSGMEEGSTERKGGRERLERSLLISRMVTIIRAYKYDGNTVLATPIYCNNATIYYYKQLIIIASIMKY